MNDSTRTIFQSAKRFFSGTALSRVSGMLRDMCMAYVFGTQVSIASFMLAFRFAHLLRRLFGEGALQAAFIPEFEALRKKNPESAFIFFRDVKILLTIFLSILILLCCSLLGAGLALGHFQEDNREVIRLTLIMLPSLLFICLYGLNASLLQCEKSYFTPAVAPVGFNFVQICCIAALYYRHPDHAMNWLAGGVIAASLFQWLLTVPKTLTVLKNNVHHSFWKTCRPNSENVRALIGPLTLGIVGVAASQVNNAVDALFGRLAEPEGPAYLWYSIRLQQLPLALFGVAVSGAILPPLSRAIKSLDRDKYLQFIDYALRSTILIMVPVTLFVLISGDTCVNLIYGRGDFTSHSIAGTTYCLWAYGLGLIPSALVLILAPACYARGNYRSPAIASFITMGLNAVLNAWLIFQWGFGAMSVAFATSFSAWVNVVFLSRSLAEYGDTLWTPDLMKYIGKIVPAAAIAFLGVLLLRSSGPNFVLPLLLTGQTPDFPDTFREQAYAVLSQGICFAGLFLWITFFGIIKSVQKRLLTRTSAPR